MKRLLQILLSISVGASAPAFAQKLDGPLKIVVG